MHFANLSKKHLSFALILAGFTCLFSFVGNSAALAQGGPAFIREIRKLETEETGIQNPAGLAFSARGDAFHVVERRRRGEPPLADTDFTRMTPFADRVGSTRIAATIKDPINTAFDNRHNRLLIFQSPNNQLVEVSENAADNLDPSTMIRHDAQRFGLQDPQGMTVDPASGYVFILDAVGPRIIRIEPEPDGAFADAAVSETDLRPTGLTNVRGIAFDPSSDHLHVLNLDNQTLYELTQTGEVVASRDLAAFELRDPQGMVFAPSADLTDDPATLDLYIADSGLVEDARQIQGAGPAALAGADFRLYLPLISRTANGASEVVSAPQTNAVLASVQESGTVVELSFTELAAPAATTAAGILIQTIDTSQFSPPSPDPSGIAYLSASGTLLIADSEVDEMPIFTGDNLFESSLSGILINTLTTISYSDEPSGASVNPWNGHLFTTDDTGIRTIYELNPGSDGLYNTSDDSVTSFATAAFGSMDPKGVTYAPGASDGSGILFIVDGVNREIYRIDPGPNGLFDGMDDQVTHFDTLSRGLDNPEGIVFNPDTGHLYAVGEPTDILFELTAEGNLVQTIDISVANARKLSGLAYAPGSQTPTQMSIYIVDRGVDNNTNPNENDGLMYEMTLPQPPTSNVPPVANDDSTLTIKEMPVTIDVVANDSDLNGNQVPASANTTCTNGCANPTNGSLINHGDGTFTYTPNTGYKGPDNFVYEICDTDALCDTATATITVFGQQVLYISSSSGGTAGGVAFQDEDILAYDLSTGTWSMYFDGSDVGLDLAPDIDAFHINADGSILLSLVDAGTVPDVGSIDDSDIVRFIPTSTGDNTAGTYEWYFDGSDVGLETNGEDIDAIGFTPDGRLVISTIAAYSVSDVSGNDEDLLVFTATSLGETTSGSWELYFAGSNVDLNTTSDEDINGTWIDENGDIYLTTLGGFSVPGAAGDGADIFTCVPGATGVNTSCTFSLAWDGSIYGFAGEIIDGFALGTLTGPGNQTGVVISTPVDGSTFFEDSSITFSGTASDFEDGDLTANLAWESDLDGPIGNGGSFSRSDLSVGVHTITATVTDSEGQTAVDSVTITVFADMAMLVGAGDIADDKQWDEATATLLETIPGTVVTLGDNAYPNGTAAEFDTYYEPTWGRHKARTRPATGNHDYDTGTAAAYFNYFGGAAGDPAKGYYSYDVGDWHIIVLNTECAQVGGCGSNDPQGQWLQADLVANPNTGTLAIMHKPLFASSSSSTAGQDFWSLLYQAGADVVLSGHAHFYERFAPQDPNGVADPVNGIRQFVVGTGGGSLHNPTVAPPNSEVRDSNTWGVLKLTLQPTSYDWEFVPIAGQTFTDSGSAPCVTLSSNQPPVVNAGLDQTITLPASASLVGTVSDDGLPNPPGAVTTTWSQVSGPGTVTFVDANAINTMASFSAEGTYVLQLTAHDGALSASDQVTITVNPMVPSQAVCVGASQDAYLQQDSPDRNHSSENDLKVKPDAGKERHAVIQFSLTAIPAGSEVVSADLLLYEDNTRSNQTIFVHRLTNSWVGSQVTWDNRSSGTAWATPGGDFDPTLEASFTPDIEKQYRTIDLTSVTQAWVNGTSANYGLLLRSTGNNGEVKFKSSEEGHSEKRPQLCVTYQ